MINILIKSITALKFNLVNVVSKILMFFPYISMECTVFTICNILYMCLAFPKFTMFYLSYLNTLNTSMNAKFICGLTFELSLPFGSVCGWRGCRGSTESCPWWGASDRPRSPGHWSSVPQSDTCLGRRDLETHTKKLKTQGWKILLRISNKGFFFSKIRKQVERNIRTNKVYQTMRWFLFSIIW